MSGTNRHARLVVDQHCVTLAERAPPRVLPGEADVVASTRSEPNASASPNAHRPRSFVHLAVSSWRLQLGVDGEPFGDVANRGGDVSRTSRDAGELRRLRSLRGQSWPACLPRPRRGGSGSFEGGLQQRVESRRGGLLGLFHGDVAPLHQGVGVAVTDRRVLARCARTSAAGCSSGRRPRCDRRRR